MESRKLKRYDSAPISTGTSTAAAARAAAHVSHIPRPQLSPPPNSSSFSSKPTINASSAVASAATTSQGNSATEKSPESYEKQIEAYYRCMEEDNEALMTYYETHTKDIASLQVLVQEHRFKETVFKAMEAKTAAMEAFLHEMVDLTAPTRGLRSRGDANIRDTARNSPAKGNQSNINKATSSAANIVVAPVATMEGVRDAVQKLVAALQVASANEEKHKLTIQSLEKEAAEWKEKARLRHARTKLSATSTDENNLANVEDQADSFLPGTAKELRETQCRVRDLERRLTAATTEAKDAAAALEKLEQQQRVTTNILRRREDELTAMRGLLSTKEQLLVALENEAKATRASTANPRQGGGTCTNATNNCGGARYVRTNSAPAGTANASSRFGNETSSDRLAVTHHYRLLGGQHFVDGQEFSAESFKDAFMRSVSTLLRIPYGYLTGVEVRTHAEAVSVELDIRHSSRVHEDEIDFLLLSHDYPEVMTYLEKVQAELASKKPQDRNALRVQELQATLVEKEQETDYLRRRLRALEESVERRDSYRDVLDKDVDAALQETEGTVKELYEALQAAQREAETAQKALAMKGAQVRVLEQAKEAAAAAEQTYKQEIGKLNDQLVQAQAEVSQAKEHIIQATLQVQAEEKMELRFATFTFAVPLATSSVQRTAAILLQDSQQTRVLHALLLAYAGCTGCAIPVQVKRCAFADGITPSSSSASSTMKSSTTAITCAATLHVTVELAYYSSKRTGDTAQAEVQQRLNEGRSCTLVQEYLRMRGEAARKEATAIAEAQRAASEADQRAAAAIAAIRAETQQAHDSKFEAAASQLQEINARVTAVLPNSTSKPANTTSANTTAVTRVDQLIVRLATAEAAARRHEEDAQRATRRLAEVQQEREQVQQMLNELTARSTELRVEKEQLATQLCTAERQLKVAQASADESESALGEKVKRLESALRAKTAAAEADKEKAAEDARAAATASAARLAELEEALVSKDKEINQLQMRLAPSAAAPASSTSVASDAALPYSNGPVSEEAALREALKAAKADRHALARQVKEMETDMNDLSNIQASMRRELESAQQELRAKKHDFDLLAKQLIRMEEKERKWQSDKHVQQQHEQHQQLNSRDSPTQLAQEADAEKDDVARESLVVLTNSNTNLQQCLRKLHRTMNAMGINVNVASTPSTAGVTTSSAEDNGGSNIGGSSRGARRSGHRRGALAATVSRAANDHQQLSEQLSELLLKMLDELENGLGSNSNNKVVLLDNGRRHTSEIGAAFSRTSSYQTNPNNKNSNTGTSMRIVKQHISNSPFARTRSTPVLAERVSQGTNDSAASPCHTPKGEKRKSDTGAAYASPSVVGSGGKATVDAAPRLDFHRQTSSRAYTHGNTTTAVAGLMGSSNSNTNSSHSISVKVPPTSGNSTSATEPEKERRSRELAQRRMGNGTTTTTNAATSHSGNSGGSYANAPRRYNPSSSSTATTTATAKSNPFRRTNTVTGSALSGAASPSNAVATGAGITTTGPGNTSIMRVNSGYRRMPTSTTDTVSSTHKPYRTRF